MTPNPSPTTPAQPPPWHALPAAHVLARLETTPDGLSEAEARRRLARFGPNELRATPPTPAWRTLAAQLRSVVVLLLVAAAALALATGERLDAAAIAAVLVLNTGLGFATELRARRAMEALLRLQPARATALRDGRPRTLDARELVPGDILLLEAGQAVPADARILEAVELQTNEAALTGESLPVPKRAEPPVEPATPLPDRQTMVYRGTAVVAGGGRAVVTATAMETEVGRIGRLAGEIRQERTPLERRLDQLGRRLVLLALAIAAAITALGIAQGAPAAATLATGIALAIAAVPEGLPAVATITLALGLRRMARRNALVRRLPAVETLGSVTTICTDKTGTLTAGEMTVTTLWVARREIHVSGIGYAPEGEFSADGHRLEPAREPALLEALETAALANRAGLARENGRWTPHGDPTEAALLTAALKAGLDRDRLLQERPETAAIPFSSERMLMATFHRTPHGLLACVKGAPDRVLRLCTRLRTEHGEEPLDDDRRRAILDGNDRLARRGLRVLALARGPVPGPDERALHDLTFLALAGMLDPPAPGVPETIRAFREAGIRTVMLTGDQRATAEAIGRTLGVLGPDDETMDGYELERISDDELARRAPRTAAFSRIGPEHKLRIVTTYRRQGEIVAMLGDGVNDAPALRKADIGVAMGRRGTDVAKEAADLILQDDRFPTIAAAIEEGRTIFDNIRKFVFYLFSCNLAEILVLLAASLAGFPTPLTPLQILWLNLITDTFPALALALEPPEPDIMRRPAREPRAAILSPPFLRAIAFYATLMTLPTLAAFAWGLHTGPARATTLAFMTLALAQIFHLGNARSPGAVLVPRIALRNPYAIAAVIGSASLQLAAAYLPPLADTLDLAPLALRHWTVIAPLALTPALVGQALKLLRPTPTRTAAGHPPAGPHADRPTEGPRTSDRANR